MTNLEIACYLAACLGFAAGIFFWSLLVWLVVGWRG